MSQSFLEYASVLFVAFFVLGIDIAEILNGFVGLFLFVKQRCDVMSSSLGLFFHSTQSLLQLLFLIKESIYQYFMAFFYILQFVSTAFKFIGELLEVGMYHWQVISTTIHTLVDSFLKCIGGILDFVDGLVHGRADIGHQFLVFSAPVLSQRSNIMGLYALYFLSKSICCSLYITSERVQNAIHIKCCLHLPHRGWSGWIRWRGFTPLLFHVICFTSTFHLVHDS
mmetsp:Transcript_34120/g.61283  ORF Transcript_34120/g.61283 Transcript_34120/m.61283 type:complete len:225 (-) Transcript_34120:596-1270(-)